MTPIKVLLVDDQLLFRKGLRSLLEEQEDIEIVGEASDGLEAINLVPAVMPEVILMDLNMPVCNGADATREIKMEHPQVRIAILTVSEDDDDLFNAIKGGADGYLLKDLQPEELIELVRGLQKGETAMSPLMAGKLLDEFRRRPSQEPSQVEGTSLTRRELEVLQLVTEGLSNTEISSRLYIVEGTVKNHIHNILEKLHLANRVQAAAYAMREGLIRPPQRGKSEP